MAEPGRVQVLDRNQGRREDDRQLLEQIFRHSRVSRVGRIILSEMNLDDLFGLIMEQTEQILGVKRCTVFLHDRHSDQLWSMIATGLAKTRIRISSKTGVAGWVFRHREPLIINDAYADHRFYPGVDKTTGFHTENILCLPLTNRSDACIGVIQVLNKLSGDFNENDRELLSAISHYVSIALENARLYEELKRAGETRQKVIDHLSHELGTPIAIIRSGLNSISKTLSRLGVEDAERPVNRCRRNVKRLMSLQEKIADILNHRPDGEPCSTAHMVETALSLTEEIAEEIAEENRGPLTASMNKVLERLASVYSPGSYRPCGFDLAGFLHDICDEAEAAMGRRDIEIRRSFQPGPCIHTDRGMLEKVCAGLLKNAIEATPDEGRIRVEAHSNHNGIDIRFRDWGVGITGENQESIFSGFFHTQDTRFYASKTPYAFYAGGSGSDLLRAKVFSERYGFSVAFTSRCCRYIPGVKNMCPGKISDCAFVESVTGCMAAGGSTFSLHFPDGNHGNGG